MFDTCEVEAPEMCVCGKDNADLEGKPVFELDPAFCSKKCLDEYVADCKRAEEWEARQYEEDTLELARTNKGCPTGECVNSNKLCRHLYPMYYPSTAPEHQDAPEFYTSC